MSIITKNENIGDKIQVTLDVNELLSHEKVYNSQFNNQSDWKKVFIYYKNESKTENETLIFKNIDSNSSSIAYFNPINTTENFLVTKVIILTKQGTYLVIRRSDLFVENFDVNYAEIAGSSISFDFIKKINSENEIEYGRFGEKMSLSGDYLTVSSEIPFDQNGPLINNISQRYGKIHIYKKDEGGTDNWGHIKTITLNDGEGGYLPPFHKLLNKQLLVLFGNDLYIYKKDEGGTDNWGLAKKITNFSNNFDPSTFFAYKNFIVGTSKSFANSYPNSLFIFEKNEGGIDNWGLVQTITISEGIMFNVHMQGIHLAVKVNPFDSSKPDKIYLYRKFLGSPHKWGFVTSSIASTLVYPPLNFSDNFGNALLIYEDYIIVGTLDFMGGDGNSKFYIYKKDEGGIDNWGLIKTITPSPNYTGFKFAIYKDILVVGVYGDDGSNDNLYAAGQVYIYKKDEGGVDNWGLIQTLNSQNENAQDVFGRTIVFSDGRLIVAAPGDEGLNDNVNDAGEIHIYKY
jgi:hypothetical protein